MLTQINFYSKQSRTMLLELGVRLADRHATWQFVAMITYVTTGRIFYIVICGMKSLVTGNIYWAFISYTVFAMLRLNLASVHVNESFVICDIVPLLARLFVIWELWRHSRQKLALSHWFKTAKASKMDRTSKASVVILTPRGYFSENG